MRKYKMQLVDLLTDEIVQTSGGVVYVAANGDAQKVTLYNANGSAKSNPVSLNNGSIEFYTADSVAKVDLYIQAPGGQGIVRKNVLPSGDASLKYVRSTNSILVIPFAIADTTANTETTTGFVHPSKGGVLPDVAVEVLTSDSGMTIDVGTLSTDSGDADGFIDGISLTSTGIVKATLTNGSVTKGALLKVQDSANAGDAAPEMNVSMQGKAITYTLSSSTDTGEGFIKLPVQCAV